jgi:hypothetical protein
VRAEVDHGGAALRYVLTLFVLDGIAYPLGVCWQRGPQGRRAILAYAAGTAIIVAGVMALRLG